MAKRLIVLLASTLAACHHFYDDPSLRDVSGQATAGADGGPIYDGETTHIVGRTAQQSDGSYVLSWPGTTVSTRFSGASVDVGLELLEGQKETFFQVVLDGNAAGELTVDGNTTSYTVTANGAGPHELTLVKLNEAMDSVVAFHGFSAAAGGELMPTRRPTGRRLLFIGDSITCGYGNLGVITTLMLTSSPNTAAGQAKNSLRDCNDFLGKKVYEVSSAYQAFGTQTARYFDAEWQLISWSGKGVYRNADGTQSETIPDIWQRSVATDGTTTYDASAWVPQAIMINLGTNDFGSIAESQNPNGGPPNVQLFRSRYEKLLHQVRAAYPNAWIYVATGPMLSDYYPTTFKALSTMRTTLASIIAAAGDGRVKFFEFPLNITTDTDATGCEWHPDADQDTTMSARFQGSIKTDLAWK